MKYGMSDENILIGDICKVCNHQGFIGEVVGFKNRHIVRVKVAGQIKSFNKLILRFIA